MHDLFKASLRAKTLQAVRTKVKLCISKKKQFSLDITLHLFLNIAQIDNYVLKGPFPKYYHYDEQMFYA